MLHYLKSLEDWCDDETWQLSQLPQTSWSILNDTFHTTLCLEETVPRIAAAVLYFAVSSTGLKIPSETAQRQWWQVGPVAYIQCRANYKTANKSLVNLILARSKYIHVY